ncbi:MAG: hypothetical protein KAU95_00855, partial [Candidatus Aenigmarchaeota archaeon]|nr:hypothetical protein [Candidatus Aenigmarchaeota archaeon]
KTGCLNAENLDCSWEEPGNCEKNHTICEACFHAQFGCGGNEGPNYLNNETLCNATSPWCQWNGTVCEVNTTACNQTINDACDNCYSQHSNDTCSVYSPVCNWEGYGWCDNEFGKWGMDCHINDNKSTCDLVEGCRWKSGDCMDKGCWSYHENAACTNETLHPTFNCTWRSDGGGGGWCEQEACWNYWNESACEANNGSGCTWHSDSWNPEGGWCEEPGCWSYHDNVSCSEATDPKGTPCEWKADQGGFGGWCEMGGCWSKSNNQTACASDETCSWRQESHCERARCWMWDLMNNGNESICVNNTYNLTCEWNDGWCMQSNAGCKEHTNKMDCFDTMFCWWDEGTGICNSPGDMFGGGDWMIEMEGEKTNPGCWIFDYASDYCDKDNYVDVCKWNNATSKCTGLSAGVEIKCGNIKDSTLCESISMLSTCCTWRNSACEAAPESMTCYTNMEEPPEGAKFCEDYVAYTDNKTCVQIAGSPWFMPCKWDGSHCVFRSEDKFGGEMKGCDAVTSKKDCEFAGCDWKTDFYCENTTAVPFGWCEKKTGIGAKSCNAVCWACEYQNDGSDWNNESGARTACEGSALGYCEFTAKSTAPNGWGYCEMSEIIQHIGDCDSNCMACESKPDPESACVASNAKCKWVGDNTGATTVGGWCYSKDEKSCSEDCFRCYDQLSCANYGGGSKGTCVWETDICKPKNFDKEICFNGQDDDNDGKVDCADSNCFSDPFCGAGVMSDCWNYDSQEDCLSEGNESGCIWIVDPWEDEAWCGLKGENCFLWDGDLSGCDNQPMCDWFTSPGGGFCEVNNTKTQECFLATTQGACSVKPDCSWVYDSTSSSGGVCEPKVFLCNDKTTQSDCASGAWSSRCAWIINEFGNGECEPICFSKSLNTDSACANNANCQWMTGICDPADSFGMKMEDCWKYDGSEVDCNNAKGCDYQTDMKGGFCDINFTLDKEVCMGTSYIDCNNATNNETCKWNGGETDGWCDLRIHGCGWYNETNCNSDPQNYGGCTWIKEAQGKCECTIPWEVGGCEVGTPHGCSDFNQSTCGNYEGDGCMWKSFGPSQPHCEPNCFNQTNSTLCDGEDFCLWRGGFCEPKMMKMMFEGMEEKPIDLGGDECPETGIPKELDICGFGLKEMPDNYGFGAGVVSLEDTALCKGKKVIKAEMSMGQPTVITDSGTGTNTTKFYLYLDTDGSETGGCWLWNDPDQEGYEFFFKYVVEMEDGEVKETKTAYRCKSGNWVIADIKLSAWRTLMCSEIGSLMVAVDRGDLKKFSDIFTPGEVMRVYVASAGKKRTESNPKDTAGPGYYTPGAVDFRFEDCMTPGVDMDGDGFKSENDPDCFMFFKSGGFMKHEDCFETGVDEDGDGLVDCNDPDCKFAYNCAGKGVNAGDYTDSTAPKLTWKEVERYPDAAFIKYDTDEPSSGTILFYHNQSKCNADGVYNRTINDPAGSYKNWHDGPIDNFAFNPQKLNYTLANGTTYYYKIQICDSSDNCGLSTCLNFTTTASASKKDCPNCYAIVPGGSGLCGKNTQKILYNETTDIPLLVGGESVVVIEGVKGQSFENPNITSETVTTSGGDKIGV